MAVVAPAGPVPDDLLDAGLDHLRSWGLRVIVGKHVRERHPHLAYLAGTDTDRAADLLDAWCDPNVAGVLCARGGYGSTRVLGHLDWNVLAAAEPKIFTGSSDITALHSAFSARLNSVTLFSPMIASNMFVADDVAREHFRRTLFEPQTATVLTASAAAMLRPGRARGITYGGNLTLLANTLATPEAPPAHGIAVLEDINERPYRLDRCLTQLLRAGWFERAAGIALGSWTGCGPADDVRATLLDRLGDLGIPMIEELGFGHCSGQHTVALGVPAELDADTGELTLLRPALL